MIKAIKEYFFGKEPVLWFPDERIWVVESCEKMPSIVGMELPTPKKGQECRAVKGVEFRVIIPTEVVEDSGVLEIKTKYIALKAKLKKLA